MTSAHGKTALQLVCSQFRKAPLYYSSHYFQDFWEDCFIGYVFLILLLQPVCIVKLVQVHHKIIVDHNC